MSSSATSNPTASKLYPPSVSSSYFQSSSQTSQDSSKRSNSSSGGPGLAIPTRQVAQPRGTQTLRKQHKGQKKPRLFDEDSMAEATAMRSINSRKGQTSITHLMNFSLPPRPNNHYQHHFNNHRHQRRNPTWGLGSGYHAVDKARYVHANYRFIVRPDREYHAQTTDADIYVSWDAILQVLASADTQAASCPICLSTPVAPRMAKCGHIFCLPCLIRYMHSTEDTNPAPDKRPRWKKCPICEDSIYISDARPVRWFSGQDASLLREGGDVLLKLLRRHPGTTLALPRDTADSFGHPDDIPWFHVAEIMDYARFMKGSEEYMHAQYDREIHALQIQEQEDALMFDDDNTWTQKAIISINDAKQRLAGLGNPPLPSSTDVKPSVAQVPESWETASQDGGSTLTSAIHQLSISGDSTSRKPQSKLDTNSARSPTHPFYFYHSLPNFFLSPLDIRILKTAFGDFSAFPSTILPRVEHISTGHIVDEDLRKRAKYMAHLPYGCEVTFLECDWTDIISPVILDQFREDIARRRKRNHDKEAREERDRLRAEKREEDERWSSARRRRSISVPESFNESDFRPLIDHDTHANSSPGESALGSTPPWNTRTHSSFATLTTPGTSPDAARTVWGTAAVGPTSPILVAPPEPVRDDGWLQGWEKDLLDGADAVAMVEASLEGESSTQTRPAAATQKKGKKKKITLMSTNNRRGA